jgi:hypothetical protein
VACLAVAFLLRVAGLTYGAPPSLSLAYAQAAPLIAAFMRGDLAPDETYPMLHMYLVAFLLRVVGLVDPHAFDAGPSWSQAVITARLLNAALGTATVWLLYDAARRLFGWRVGLLGAALLAPSTPAIVPAHCHGECKRESANASGETALGVAFQDPALLPFHQRQPGDMWKASRVPGGDSEPCRDGGGGDEQVMSAHGAARRGQLRPQTSVDARHHEVERNDGHGREHLLDERLASSALGRLGGAMDPMEELRGGDGRQGDHLVGFLGHDRVQIEPPALGRDQHAGVYQRRHGDFGSAG